jgi:cytolysin-activating lysine-acyltransferase
MMNEKHDSAEAGTAFTDMADAAFHKLPVLGPISWLYARTQDRRFMFLADLDWAVMPPVVLDQCRLFMKGQMPFAFFTWAWVSDEVQQRLMEGNGKLAPHEWKSGPHLWLIDLVTPFGGSNDMLTELHRSQFKDQLALRYLALNPAKKKPEVQTFMAPLNPSVAVVH